MAGNAAAIGRYLLATHGLFGIKTHFTRVVIQAINIHTAKTEQTQQHCADKQIKPETLVGMQKVQDRQVQSA